MGNSLQKLGKLANSRIAHKNIQLPKRLDSLLDEQLARLGLTHIALDLDQLACFVVFLFQCRRFGEERILVVGVGGEVEVVDGDVAALAEELEGDGAADSGGAAGYGGGFGEEEVVCHLLFCFALILFCF